MNKLKNAKKTLLRLVLERNFYKSENYEHYKFERIFCKYLLLPRLEEYDDRQYTNGESSQSIIYEKRIKLSS